LRTRRGFEGTIEFFPEEGKYHLDGHRNCGVRLTPDETMKNGFICPVCRRKLTVGVMHRVQELADREVPKKETFKSIIPLQEIVAECEGRGVNTKGVQKKYFDLLGALGPEFGILLDVPLREIGRQGGEKIAEAISKMRGGDIYISPGFDGEYGKVKIFGVPGESKKVSPRGKTAKKRRGKQSTLF
jgi:DNA helicase-2/ATP-dependent DNA helicase PcrA